MNIEALKAVRENFKMGYVLSFAEAMLIQQAIDSALHSANSAQPATVPDESWRIEAEKQAEIYGQSFVMFRNGEQPQCADPTKVVISFTDKGLGHNAAPDGWIPVSERLPPCKTGVLVATEMDGPGDWRMKWATYVPEHPDAINGWLIPGASWTPTHWQPLPDAPKVTP